MAWELGESSNRKRMREKEEEMGTAESHPRGNYSSSKEDDKENELTPQEMLEIMEEAIVRVTKFLYDDTIIYFTSDELDKIRFCASTLSSLQHFPDYAGRFYETFHRAVKAGIQCAVIPALEGKKHGVYLIEILKKWSKFRSMLLWLAKFYKPLRLFCSFTKKIQLDDFAYYMICDQVFDPHWNKLRSEIIRMINLDRAGAVVDRDLLKSCIGFIAELETSAQKNYYTNFEEAFLRDTAASYRKASLYSILAYSYDDYMKKAVRCIKMETKTRKNYLPYSTVDKLVEVLNYELID